MDREAWHAAVHGVTKSQTWVSGLTELNQGALIFLMCPWVKHEFRQASQNMSSFWPSTHGWVYHLCLYNLSASQDFFGANLKHRPSLLMDTVVCTCEDWNFCILHYGESLSWKKTDSWKREGLLLLLLSRFSSVRLCATPWTAAHQAPPSLGFSRQELWSGLPFPSPMHESEKWKWSRSVISDS